MNCTICGKPVVLVPSAEHRAAKDCTGKTAAYYRSLFTTHADCELKKRREESLPRPLTDLERVQYAGRGINLPNKIII